MGNPAGGRWAACPRTGGSLGACRTLPEALGAASMADGRFAGDGTGAGCAGGSGSSRVENSPILARNPVIRGFETRFSAAKSGDPGIKNGQWSPFSGKVRRSRESDTFARLPSERSDFQALRLTDNRPVISQAQGLKKPSDRRYCTRTRRRRPGSWAGVARGRRRGREGPHLLPPQRRPGCRVGLETPPDSRQSLYWRNGIVCGSVELLLGAISKAHATAIRTDPGGFGYSRKLCLINVGRIPHRTRLAAARALSGIRCCSD